MSYGNTKVVTKKAKPNGFAVFMQDMRDRYREEGQRVPSMAEMVNIANPLWSELSQKDKNYFNLRAKEASKSGLTMAKVVTDTRLDCLGEPLSDRVDEKGQTEERRKTERQFTRARWPVGKAAARCRFYFIDFQFICHVEKGNYVPCEIAAIEYSIDCGIVRSWHKFIDPGRIPTGYRWEAQNRSEQTHKIPIDKFELAENNYQLILDELQQFINPRRESEFPPIFTRKDEAEMVESCCRWLAERTEARHDLFKVYVLEYLLIDLSSHISDIAPSSHEAKDMLSSSAFDYDPGVNCAWHETREVRHCSLGTVNRLAYILSDHLCPKYNVTMGTKHFPLVKENQQHTVLSPGHQDTDFVFPSRDYRYFPSTRQTPQSANPTFEREDNESMTSFATELTPIFQPASKQGFRPPVVGSSSPRNTGLKGRGRARGRISGEHEQREVGGAYSTSGTVGDTLHDIDSESLVSAETALNSLHISSVSEKQAVQPHTPWYPPQNQNLPPDYYNPYPMPPSAPSPAPLYQYASPSSHPQSMYPPQVPNGVPQYNTSRDIGQNSISHYPGQLTVSPTLGVVSPPHLPTPNSTPNPLQQPGHTYAPTPPPLYQYPQYQPAPQQPYLYAPPNSMASYPPQQSPATLLQPQVTHQSYIPNPSQGVAQPIQQPVPVPPMLPPQTQVPTGAPPYQQYSQYPLNSGQNAPYARPQYVAPPAQAMHPNSNQYIGSVPVQQPYYPHPQQQMTTPEQMYTPANIPTQPQ